MRLIHYDCDSKVWWYSFKVRNKEYVALASWWQILFAKLFDGYICSGKFESTFKYGKL